MSWIDEALSRLDASTNVKDERNYPEWYQTLRTAAEFPMPEGLKTIAKRTVGTLSNPLQPPALPEMQGILDTSREPTENRRVNDAFKDTLMNPQSADYWERDQGVRELKDALASRIMRRKLQ